MNMNKSEIVNKLIIAIVFFPLFCHSQQKTDAHVLINTINKIPEFTSPYVEHGFRFSSANHFYTKEEIAKMKIKSITICLNNKQTYTENEKGCIKFTFDPKGNMTQSTAIDSAGKIKESIKYVYIYDTRKNIVETKITRIPGIYSMAIVYKYDTLNQLLSKKFYKWKVPKPVKSAPGNSEEIEMIKEPYDIQGAPPIDEGNFTENYEYNTLHQLMKYEVRHGNITETINFKFDSLSRVIASKQLHQERVYYKYTPHDMSKEYWADSISKNISEWEYAYDANSGNVIQTKFSNNAVTSITEYVYTKTGMFSEIQQTHNDPSQVTLKNNYYDEKGRLIKTENRTGKNNTLQSSLIYSYTDNGVKGWVQKTIVFTTLGYSETYKTFDAKARLIEEKGSHTGHTTGDIRTFYSSFSKRISFEYFK
ncbi:MAG: hypothetical protein Q8L90_06090 [Bacteroidota bacterium]|nr:hypothetical protein [Bacteroidota bacterium]